MGRLTTHVLNTAKGVPAKGLAIELWRVKDGSFSLIKSVITNDDGRVDGPLLENSQLERGQYELRFMAGDYLRAESKALPDPLFLDIIPIRFGIADTTSHYHVPLLISPYGYSTYRGS
ncbi:hydroxyisourate hydrolase [Kiloniella laminariae]|uniref:hydroxyisourate hydrolase n=1 Tax=Kiloniella laminariae TaxID=454162 RepID=UPI0003708837|nr:hydroxyisourate hydrolase [Kiloniella laminariae]